MHTEHKPTQADLHGEAHYLHPGTPEFEETTRIAESFFRQRLAELEATGGSAETSAG